MRAIGVALILLALGATFAWAQFSPSLKFAMPVAVSAPFASCPAQVALVGDTTAIMVFDSGGLNQFISGC